MCVCVCSCFFLPFRFTCVFLFFFLPFCFEVNFRTIQGEGVTKTFKKERFENASKKGYSINLWLTFDRCKPSETESVRDKCDKLKSSVRTRRSRCDCKGRRFYSCLFPCKCRTPCLRRIRRHCRGSSRSSLRKKPPSLVCWRGPRGNASRPPPPLSLPPLDHRCPCHSHHHHEQH